MRHTFLIALLSVATLTAGGAELTLLEAVKAGNGAAVGLLLKKPAGAAAVNVAEADGTAPLHWAARGDELEIARLLGERGRECERGEPVRAHAAVDRGQQRQRRDGAAAARGGRRREGDDPAGRDGPDDRGARGNPEAVRLILERGADPNAREESLGETALMWAAAENRPEAVKLLVARGAEVNARLSNITWASHRFGLEGVLTILPKGRWTALMYAARQGSLGAARELVGGPGAMLEPIHS